MATCGGSGNRSCAAWTQKGPCGLNTLPIRAAAATRGWARCAELRKVSEVHQCLAGCTVQLESSTEFIWKKGRITTKTSMEKVEVEVAGSGNALSSPSVRTSPLAGGVNVSPPAVQIGVSCVGIKMRGCA